MKILYVATVTTTGGRNGHLKSDNGVLELDVRSPKALGGANDEYTNPEQLFAGGYSACFGSALLRAIQHEKVETGEPSVTAVVSMGVIENGAFGLAVELKINVPKVSLEQAQKLADEAHKICPYSNATRGNIDVKLTVSNNE